MQRKATLTAIPLCILLAASEASAQDRFEWSEIVASGRTLELKGVNGSIQASSIPGGRAYVVATKSSRRSDTAEVQIRVVEQDGNFTVCAVYPGNRSDPPNECRPGQGGRMTIRNSFDVRVDFTVQVPLGVRLVARTVNGGIAATGLESDVEAYTVNGNIDIGGRGLARARTVNGSIDASMGRADWQDTLEFETVNGSITVKLPASLSTAVDAETVSGSIQTDFALNVSGRLEPRHISGTIRGTDPPGNRRLRLRTVNGQIRLQRSS